jgi:hypothetical protein
METEPNMGTERNAMRIRSLAVRCVLTAALAGALGVARAQETQPKPPAKQTDAPAGKPTQDVKSVLLGASRASTAQAAEGAAKEKSKSGGKEASAKAEGNEESPKGKGDDAVTELRPLPPGQEADKKEETGKGKKKSRSGPVKNVHGSVYGGSGGAAQAAGGEAGASTRSGKTHVYVEGQSARQGAPQR